MSFLKIPQHILDEMIAHARELDPLECCGLLAGKDDQITHLYRIKNVVALEGAEKLANFDEAKIAHLQRLSPHERAEIAFVLDAHDLSLAQKDMRAKGIELKVVYHSHPKDPARPSVTDKKIATDYEDNWNKINLAIPVYLIISLKDKLNPDLQVYRIQNNEAFPVEFQPI